MPYDNIIVQGVEYKFSTFSISDGAFGSCFYFATGFHGLSDVALFIYLFISLKTEPSEGGEEALALLFTKVSRLSLKAVASSKRLAV